MGVRTRLCLVADYITCTMPKDGQRPGEQDAQPRLHTRRFPVVTAPMSQTTQAFIRSADTCQAFFVSGSQKEPKGGRAYDGQANREDECPRRQRKQRIRALYLQGGGNACTIKRTIADNLFIEVEYPISAGRCAVSTAALMRPRRRARARRRRFFSKSSTGLYRLYCRIESEQDRQFWLGRGKVTKLILNCSGKVKEVGYVPANYTNCAWRNNVIDRPALTVAGIEVWVVWSKSVMVFAG